MGDLYGVMFTRCGILPSELARQDPELLFMMLDSLYEEPEIPPELAFFYGD